MLSITGDLWLAVKDGDERAAALYLRHYSAHIYKDGRRRYGYRNRFLIVGPGEKLLLLTPDCRAVFAWRRFIDRSGQEGVNCAIFRNEGAFNGAVRSSDLILAAEDYARQKWGGGCGSIPMSTLIGCARQILATASSWPAGGAAV